MGALAWLDPINRTLATDGSVNRSHTGSIVATAAIFLALGACSGGDARQASAVPDQSVATESTSSNWSVVTVSSAGDGIIRLGNGFRQWLPPTCMVRLRAANVPVAIVAWDQVSSLIADNSQTTCAQIASELGDEDSTWSVVIVSDDGDGLLVLSSGERQWLPPDCLSELRGAGVPIARVSWDAVRVLPEVTNAATCTQIADDLLGPEEQQPTIF